MIPWLDESLNFPDVYTALDEPNGLLAAGGDLSCERLLTAYRLGIFPWYSEPDPVLWWSPSPRCVLLPDELHIARSLRKTLKGTNFSVTTNRCFSDVILACAAPRNYTDETWITDEMHQAYCQLHELGYAHSVEVWHEEQLVGGLYGIAIGQAFFGESMFSTYSNASKVAFVHLVKALKHCGFQFIDCQVHSTHLQSLGAKDIDRETFQQLLKSSVNASPTGNPWQIIGTDYE